MLYSDLSLYLKLLLETLSAKVSTDLWPFVNSIHTFVTFKNNNLNYEHKLTDVGGGKYSTSAKESIDF